MSYARNLHFGYLVYDTFADSRTVAEIQRKTIKQSKRNVLSRLIHSGSGKGTIATWRSDLNRTLLAFNVCSRVCVLPLLTINSQNEFADVMNTHTLGSDVHRGVLNTHAIVSDIHRNVLKSKDWTDGQHRAVGDTLALRRCTTSQAQNRSAISTSAGYSVSYLHLAHLGNLLPRHRGSVLDVTS